MGILRDDPRLAPLVDSLKDIMKQNPSKIFSINNIHLEYQQFNMVVKSCKCLISDVMEGNVIIPEFEDFCESIKEMYSK